ncbi:mannose-1-phosphate guanylyltransferase [Fervidobacterium thailandense]|uniref:Mannose-1-phosphate guanylyltransferase n=1 Tax=Fervidobacterium thailandense TaxID=1008305 RepID=A0A1E3G0G0_9BACT|nr:mannose-1-phosphate guanylyltransferase [Fervidobacterium thailandense]ODN29729.1 mannose-1-phosphate guanylyltransferase [Fervidobacterium thailandense]
MKAVILAGGTGERFWPLSTVDTPKQFLKLFSQKTLLRETFERLSYKLPVEDILVVTNERYAERTYEELPELPLSNILLEPARKNTAAACVYATLKIEDGENVLVVPADHYIPEAEKFWECVELGQSVLDKFDGIVTFGIVPTRPETGYGYIEVGEFVTDGVYVAKKFHEKPTYDVALDYLESGNFFWNSGMFMWKKEYFLSQMKKHAPDVLHPFLECEDVRDAFSIVPSISIDYALMEKADKIFMVKANFIWSDVGNWKSLQEIGIGSTEPSVLLEAENVFVRTTKPTIVLGVSDIIVVETENGILIADRKDLEKIREALKRLG